MGIAGFTFAKCPIVHFGRGSIGMLPKVLEDKKGAVLMILSHSFEASDTCKVLLDNLGNKGIKVYKELASGEPSPDVVDRIVSSYTHKKLSAVVGIGGGSIIDAGKAISAMLPSGEAVKDYLEGVGYKKHNGEKIFYIAVPTSSGTGSEASKNAVISRVGEGGFKKSIRHDNLVPDMAIVDPLLAVTCPKHATAACGLDALTQLMEAYTSVRAYPMTDALCISGIKAVGNGFSEAYRNGSNIEAREHMAYGALMSGICLANAGLGIVHGLASPIGGMFPIPHGVVCGTLLYEATCTNIDRMLLDKGKYEEGLNRYSHIGRLLTGREDLNFEDGLSSLKELLREWTVMTGMRRLSEYGVKECHIEEIARVTSNKENPIILDSKAIEDIMRRRL